MSGQKVINHCQHPLQTCYAVGGHANSLTPRSLNQLGGRSAQYSQQARTHSSTHHSWYSYHLYLEAFMVFLMAFWTCSFVMGMFLSTCNVWPICSGCQFLLHSMRETALPLQ